MSSIIQSADELLGKIRTPVTQENIHARIDPTSTERNAPMPGQLPGRVDSIAAAIAKNNPLVNILRQAQEPDTYWAPEMDWYEKATPAELAELTKDIDPSEHWRIRGTTHPMEARRVADDIRERNRLNAIQFANGNVLGMASEIASYLDPVAMTTGSAALSVAATIPKALRLGKAAQRLGGAAGLGAFTAGEEMISQYGRTESRDEDDVLYAALAGIAAGGVFGPSASRALEASLDARFKTVAQSIMDTMDESLVRNPGMDTRPFRMGADDATNTRGLDIEVTPEVRAAMKDKTLTQNFSDGEVQIATRADELVARGEVVPMPDKGWVRTFLEKNPAMTDGFRMLMSKSNAARVAISHFGELAIGRGGKIPTSAAMYKLMHESQYLRMIPILEDSQNAFLAARGIKQWNVMKYNGSGKRMFDEELISEMGRRNAGHPPNPNIDPHIKRAADALDEATKRGLDDLKAAGWAGADEVQWKPGYFTLSWQGSKIQQLHSAGRAADVKGLLNKVYTNVGMSPELAERLSSAIINRKLATAADLDFNPAALFSKASRGELRQLLDGAGVSELDIRGIMKLTEGDAGGALKTRTNLDLNAEFNGLRVTDLIETDIGNLMSRWAQRTGGMVGLAKKGLTSFEDIDMYKKVIRSQSAGAGEDVEKLGRSVDALFDQLLARPVNGGVDRNMRRLLDWSMTTKLGQLVFAQTAEMNNLSAAYGVVTALKSIPAANKMHRQLIKAAKSGDYSQIDKKWFAEMQVLGGNMIDEHLLYRPAVRLDESTVSAGWMGTFDNVMAMAVDKLGYMSGMYQVKGLEQSLVVMLETDKIVKALRGPINKKTLSRIGEVGWDDAFLTRLKGQIDANATFNKGVLDRLNLENWDEATRTEFLSGMHRRVHQMIQRPLPGEGMYWAHSNVGALVTQFRSFPLLAMEKQTGRHLLAGDAETGAAVMYGLAWATTAGLVRTYTNSIGRSDRDEYLQRRLTPEALALNALNYTSTAGVFGDIAGGLGAITGMTEGGARGSRLIPPAISGITQASAGVGNILGAANPFSDVTLSERGVRNVASAIPLAGTLPFAWLTTGITQLVPED